MFETRHTHTHLRVDAAGHVVEDFFVAERIIPNLDIRQLTVKT